MPSKVRALRRGGALTRSEKKQTGPLQIVVVGFDDLKLESEIAGELKRLRNLESPMWSLPEPWRWWASSSTAGRSR
jgi:hypothetical protein